MLSEITNEKNEKGRQMIARTKDLAEVMGPYEGRKAAADKTLELSVV
jgi:hypothetical protein